MLFILIILSVNFNKIIVWYHLIVLQESQGSSFADCRLIQREGQRRFLGNILHWNALFYPGVRNICCCSLGQPPPVYYWALGIATLCEGEARLVAVQLPDTQTDCSLLAQLWPDTQTVKTWGGSWYNKQQQPTEIFIFCILIFDLHHSIYSSMSFTEL